MKQMGTLTSDYLTRAELWLFITIVLYFLMNGAQIFETAVFVPKWSASPPDSLKLLADQNGASLKTFWIVMHSLHELAFILAIIFCWKIDPVKNWLLLIFILHFAVRAWTILYFAPNIMEFEKGYSTPGDNEILTNRVVLWQKLNYLRVWLYVFLSVALIPLILKVRNMIAAS